MAKKGNIARLYDSVISAGQVVTSSYKSALRILGASSGEAGMARMVGPYGAGGYGAASLSKVEQVLHFRGWTYRCIDYICGRIAKEPPTAVLAADPKEAESYKLAQKYFLRGKGPMPDPRAFASRAWKTKAQGPARANEEYEFLDDSHPLVRLLRDPNDPETGVSLWYEWTLFGLLTGESFLWVVESDSGRSDEIELWVIPSHWVRAVCLGKEKLVDYFEVSPRGGTAGLARFDPEEIIWYKRPSPLSKIYPASPLQAMSGDIDSYEKITAARNFSLDNGAAVGGTITVPPDVQLDDGMIQRLESRFSAKYAGVYNFNRPIILEGGMVWTPAPPESELAFMQTQDQLRKYIIANWGLDEVVLGFASVANRAAMVAAIANVNEATINPLRREKASVLTEKLARRFDERCRLFWPDDTPLDPDARRTDFTSGDSLNAVSPNDYRVHVLELEPFPEEIYDRPLVSPGLVNPGKDEGQDWDGDGGPDGDPFGPAFGGGGANPLTQQGDGLQEDADLSPVDEMKANPSAAKQLTAPIDYSDPAPYGYCPECRTPGVAAERRPDGNAICANGHEYPRKSAKYASTQIEIGGDIRKSLVELANSVEEADLGEDGRELESHITVRYGLHTNDVLTVAELVSGFGNVNLTLSGISAFRGKDYDVLYVKVDSPDLMRLNEVLASLPHTDTHSTYVPHACFAYVKPGLADKYLGSLESPSATWTADRMTFSTAGREQSEVPLAMASKSACPFAIILKRGPAPFPGAVFDESSHRWIKPEEAESGQEAKPKPTSAVSRAISRLSALGSAALNTRVGRFLSAVEHKLMIVAHATRDIAEAAGLKKRPPLTEEQLARLHRVLTIADFLGGYATGAAGAAVGGVVGAKVGMLLPSASALYVAYSTVRDPAAVWSAAREVAKAMIHGKSDGSADIADLLAELLSGPDADWKEAVFLAALAEGESAERAAAIASNAGSMPSELPEPKLEDFGGDDSSDDLPSPSPASKSAPGPPPRPGLVWNEGTHRWRDPDTGEEHEHQSNAGDSPDVHEFDQLYQSDVDPAVLAKAYVRMVKDDEIDTDSLSGDEVLRVQSGLISAYSPAKLADMMASASGTSHGLLIAEAMEHLQEAPPLAFNGKAYRWAVVDKNDVSEPQYVEAMSRVIPGIRVGDLLLVPADKKSSGMYESIGAEPASLDPGPGEALGKVFDSAPGKPMVRTGDVPGEAKSGNPPGDSWDADKVEVYKRLDAEWYVKKASSADPKADTKAYEFVHKDEIPELDGLPGEYFASLSDNDANFGHDQDSEDDAARRDDKQSRAGAKQKVEIKKVQEAIKSESKVGRQLEGKQRSFDERTHPELAKADRSYQAAKDFSDRADDFGEGESEKHNEAVASLQSALADLQNIDDPADWDLLDADTDHSGEHYDLSSTHDDRASHLSVAKEALKVMRKRNKEAGASIAENEKRVANGAGDLANELTAHYRSIAEAAHAVTAIIPQTEEGAANRAMARRMLADAVKLARSGGDPRKPRAAE